MVQSDKIEFFKSLFQKILDINLKKVQRHSVQKGLKFLNIFLFKRSEVYKCFKDRTEVKQLKILKLKNYALNPSTNKSKKCSSELMLKTINFQTH